MRSARSRAKRLLQTRDLDTGAVGGGAKASIAMSINGEILLEQYHNNLAHSLEMTIFKESTPRGKFLVEVGTGNKSAGDFEVAYYKSLSDDEKCRAVWELFTQFHLNNDIDNGEKQHRGVQLRLDRTVIEFGRKKSEIPNRRGLRGRQARRS